MITLNISAPNLGVFFQEPRNSKIPLRKTLVEPFFDRNPQPKKQNHGNKPDPGHSPSRLSRDVFFQESLDLQTLKPFSLEKTHIPETNTYIYFKNICFLKKNDIQNNLGKY